MVKKRTRRKSAKSLNRPRKSYKKHFFALLIICLITLAIAAVVVSEGILQRKKLDLAEYRLEMRKPPPEIQKKIENTPVAESFHIPILMYHYIEYVHDRGDTIRQSLNIIPVVFERQIQTLKAADYTFLTMSDVADIMDGKKPPPQNPIAITIDDGYRDLYTDVLPILKQENVKVTAFIVPGFLDHPNFLLTSQFQEIADSGLVEIAAHTMHHLYLKGSSKGVITDEVVESKIQLENLIHRPVVSFAYPYGAFDEQAIDIVKNAGFKTAVSTLPGKEENGVNKFFIYRLRQGGRTGEALLSFLNQTAFKPW